MKKLLRTNFKNNPNIVVGNPAFDRCLPAIQSFGARQSRKGIKRSPSFAPRHTAKLDPHGGIGLVVQHGLAPPFSPPKAGIIEGIIY